MNVELLKTTLLMTGVVIQIENVIFFPFSFRWLKRQIHIMTMEGSILVRTLGD